MSNEELCTLAKGGDIEARNRLLENNLSYIRQQANKVLGQNGSNRLDVDDLVQEGCFGLMEAISRFNPERGTKFLTYAVWWVRKFMQETVSIVLANDEVCLSELEEFSLPQVYGKSPEQIVLQAETYAELHDGLRQISARKRTYLLYRYGFTDGDEHPIPETAAHFHLTEKREKKTEQTALDGLLKPGIPFAPAEGDASTGMTATNAVAPRTGNVSVGTSIFSMVVLEKSLSKVHEEIDLVTTPTGAPVAMVHCNNCTNDTNAWAGVLRETVELFGASPDTGTLYTKPYEKSLEGEANCGGVTVCNCLAGEGVTHMDAGCPLVVRTPEARFTLANFFRAQLYSTMATLKIGMDTLASEGVAIDSLTGHGGLFKTPLVGQRYLAAACGAPVICMDTAGEGGPYSMALLAAYRVWKTDGETLKDYLNKRVFAGVSGSTVQPDMETATGFHAYMERYRALLQVEQKAVEVL